MALSNKYSALELMLVERIQEGETVIRWVHSKPELADACLVKGAWTLVDDPTFTSLKMWRRSARAERCGMNLSA